MKLYKKHISDLGKVVTGKTPRTSILENYGGKIPFLTPSDNLSEKFSPTTSKTLTKIGLNEVKNCLLPSKSICVSCIGSDLGKVVLTKKPTVTNQQFNSIVPNEENDADFIYYLMTVVGKHLNYLSKTSTAVPIINKSTFANYEIEIPNIKEQKRIGKILSSLDDKIELNRRINDNLEQQAQALFKSWFVDFEPFKKGKFIDSELGMIPEGWRVGTLNELIISTLGGDWGKEDAIGNYVKKVSCIRGADIPEIRQGNRGNMPTRFILNKNFLNKALKAEDLVVEISGGSPTQSTGRICQISDTLLKKYDDVVICTNFCRAIKTKRPYSQFIYYLWEYLYKRGVMFLYENGTTGIKNLDINGLLEKEIIVIPDENTVHKYTGICNLFSQIVQSNGYESERLVRLRDTLLPKLMSGELKINDINN